MEAIILRSFNLIWKKKKSTHPHLLKKKLWRTTKQLFFLGLMISLHFSKLKIIIE